MRRFWLLVAVVLLVAAGLGLGYLGLRDRLFPAAAEDDPGVAMCRTIAAEQNLPDSAKHSPTEDDIAERVDAFDESRYPQLRAAGINYFDEARKMLYGTGVEKGDLGEVLQRRALLASACEDQGVAVTFPAPSIPPIELPTMPTLPEPPLPTNPYDN